MIISLKSGMRLISWKDISWDSYGIPPELMYTKTFLCTSGALLFGNFFSFFSESRFGFAKILFILFSVKFSIILNRKKMFNQNGWIWYHILRTYWNKIILIQIKKPKKNWDFSIYRWEHIRMFSGVKKLKSACHKWILLEIPLMIQFVKFQCYETSMKVQVVSV